jgi:hypothetical protein
LFKRQMFVWKILILCAGECKFQEIPSVIHTKSKGINQE